MPWSADILANSYFFRASESVAMARARAARALRAYRNGEPIGFTREASLKSMGKIRRSNGKYELGAKHCKRPGA